MEILAPGGGPAAAMAAIEAGADAIYVGLNEFSARKGANNFDFSQLQTLLKTARRQGVKIYAALNTVILDEELTKAGSIVLHLRDMGIDALILQDYGLAALCRSLVPEIPLHASTQMAVHNAEGARQLQKIGFSRVILARELTLAEIIKIQKENSGLELEVFVQGALCYSMSGLCLASGLMLSRSGNRGECGQICRTWFSHNNQNRYFFSCRDLETGSFLHSLKEAGICSAKIEGRMKSPEYVKAAVSYYRKSLDGMNNETDLEKVKQIFSRRQTQGWIDGKATPKLDVEYPGHYGVEAAFIKKVKGNKVFLDENIKLHPRDGILYFIPGNPPRAIRKSFPFPNNKDGSITLDPPPIVGDKIFRTSCHDSKAKQEARKIEIEPVTLPGKIKLDNEGIEAEVEYYNEKIIVRLPFDNQASRTPQKHQAKLQELFTQNKDSLFLISPLSFKNEIPEEWEHRFFPVSLLKKLKNETYTKLDLTAERIRNEEAELLIPSLSTRQSEFTLPKRSQIKGTEDLPFIVDFSSLTPERLLKFNERHVIALSPVCFDFGTYERDLLCFLEKYPEIKWLIGLNNPAHLGFPHLLETHNIDVNFFIDYSLYSANRSTQNFFKQQIKRLIGIYPWLEDPKSPANPANDPEFNPPLFISRHCFYKESLQNDCPAHCHQRFSFPLEQNGRHYQAKVYNCISYLLPE